MFILHTANVYLDKPFFSSLNLHYGQERRRRQRELLDAIVSKVFEYKADALFITGNLLDAEYVTEQTLQFLFERCEAIKPVPVIIIPGESDPITKYSPYILETFPENVIVMNSETTNRWEGNKTPIVVYAIAGDNRKVGDFAELNLPTGYDGRNHILLSYELPMFNDKRELSRWFEKVPDVISYIGVGKGHSFKQFYNTSQLTACCCGIPDPISMDDTPPFGVLGIRFQSDDNQWKVSHVEHMSLQKNFYALINIDMSLFTNEDGLHTKLRNELTNLQKPCVVHLRFSGTISPSLLNGIPETMISIQEENLFITWSFDGEIEGFENAEDLREITVLSEFFKQVTEQQKCAPNTSAVSIAKRVRHLTARIAGGANLKIPTVETCEVPPEWNL
ncbi:MAG: hypothetical protein ACP5UA_01465 [Candidatus Hydrogenedens sp.]